MNHSLHNERRLKWLMATSIDGLRNQRMRCEMTEDADVEYYWGLWSDLCTNIGRSSISLLAIQIKRDDGRNDRREAEWHGDCRAAGSCYRYHGKSHQIVAPQIAVVAETGGPPRSLRCLVQHSLSRHQCYSVYWSSHSVVGQEYVLRVDSLTGEWLTADIFRIRKKALALLLQRLLNGRTRENRTWVDGIGLRQLPLLSAEMRASRMRSGRRLTDVWKLLLLKE